MRKNLFLGTLLLFVAVTVRAVIPAGYITFIVTDQNGDPIEGVELVIHAKKMTTFEEKLVTDEKGQAKILLRLDDYTVDGTKEGYQPFQQIVRPELSQRKDVPISMHSLDAMVVQHTDAGELTGKDLAAETFNTAVPFLKSGNDAEALPLLEKAIEADPTLVQALFHAGRIYLVDGNLDKSEKYLTEVMNQNPDMDSLYGMLAELYKRKGDDAKYKQFLAEAESRGAVSAGEYYNQAAEMINAGDFEGAKPLLEKAISVNPDYADAYYQMGMWYVREGDYPKCMEYLKKYLELDPEGSHAQECKDFIAALGSM